MEILAETSISQIMAFICVGLVGAELTELATKIDLNVAAYIRLIGYLLTLKVADVITKKVESNKKTKPRQN